MYWQILSVCLVSVVFVVIFIPVYWKSRHIESVPWSHRCYSTVYKENTANGCKAAVESGFQGIEIDLFYENGRCIVKHDASDNSNETLMNVVRELQNYTYSLYIDLKNTQYDKNASNEIHKALQSYPPGGKIVIEIQNAEYKSRFSQNGYKTITLGTDVFSLDMWHTIWPSFYFSHKETYVFTVNTQCEYYNIAMTNPDVILVDLTSPYISCNHVTLKESGIPVGWVILWCLLWVCVAIAIYFLCRYVYNMYTPSSSLAFPYTKFSSEFF